MICDRCHKREATVHLTQVVNGHRSEQYLCRECAEKENVIGMDRGFINRDFFRDPFQDFFSNNDWFGPLMGHERGRRLNSLSCPQCGTTYADFEKTGKLGCPSCYEAFREKLRPLFKEVNGTNLHTGKKPDTPAADSKPAEDKPEEKKETESAEVTELRNKLNEAIKNEEYEKAAEIRDKIKALKGGKDHDAE